ncbi:MAG: hypothetical protein Q9190_007036 [Brigantiaea leucoxantha]
MTGQLSSQGATEATKADDPILGVPRSTVEELLRAWAGILQRGISISDYDRLAADSRTLRPKPDVARSALPESCNLVECAHNDLHTSFGIGLNNISDSLRVQKPSNLQPGGSVKTETCYRSHRDKVPPLPNWKIEAEDQRRKAVRKEWRSSQEFSFLEDSWKHLWEPKPAIDAGLFQWSCSDQKRVNLQLRLIDALNSGQPSVFVQLYMRKDFRALASWISLIGLRLNDLYRSINIFDTKAVPSFTNPFPPDVQIQVLIEYLWTCNDRQLTDRPRVGDVLTSCYERRVLEQPDFEHQPDTVQTRLTLLIHYRAVRISIFLVNTLFRHETPHLELNEELEKTWSMPLSLVERDLRSPINDDKPDLGKDVFLNVDDFNLRELQNLGHLQIYWTAYWDEHLELQTSPAANILKLYWFQPSLSQYFYAKCVLHCYRLQ